MNNDKSVTDMIMEHAKRAEANSSTGEGIEMLGLPLDFHYNMAGNTYLSALHIISEQAARLAAAEAVNEDMFAAVVSVWADHEHKGYTTKRSLELCGKAIQTWISVQPAPKKEAPNAEN